MNTNFKVIGLTRLGIKPDSAAPEADDRTTRSFEQLIKLTGLEPNIASNGGGKINETLAFDWLVCDRSKGFKVSPSSQ